METEGKQEITAKYEKDTKRYHTFLLTGSSITGSIYVPKGQAIPDELTIKLATKAQ